MKVLFVNERRGFLGGVEQNVADTSDELRARGHRCSLVYGANTERNDGYSDHFDACYECHDIGPSGRSFSSIVEQERPDVVYLHKFPRLEPLLGGLSGVHSIRVIHDHDVCCPTGLKYYRANGQTCRHAPDARCLLDGGFLARDRGTRLGVKYVSLRGHRQEMLHNGRLSQLVVDSRFMKDELVQAGFDAARVEVLPHIIKLSDGQPEPVPEAPEILYVGQLIRGKGVDLLLRALALLTREFHATIIGAGNAQTQLQELSRNLNLDRRVTFAGWVDHDKIDRCYARAKVVAVPSRWPEPYGMVGLEAMNHGRPVVAFDVGGISDWLEHETTGLLVPPQDTHAFARALHALLSDTGRAAHMGEKARSRIVEEFSFGKYVDGVEALLRAQA